MTPPTVECCARCGRQMAREFDADGDSYVPGAYVWLDRYYCGSCWDQAWGISP